MQVGSNEHSGRLRSEGIDEGVLQVPRVQPGICERNGSAHFEVAHELEYVTAEERTYYIDEYTIVGKQLTRLVQYWRSKDDATSDQ
ncbi:MAG: hypothetical protein AAB349_02270 [Chloroflexota bacterium]